MKIEFPINIYEYEFKEKIDVQKRFSDLDAYFHVNNCIQQTYFDIGREQYLRKVYSTDVHVIDENKTLFIVSYKTDFLSQITYEDEIEVCTMVYHIGDKSLKMIQILRDKRSKMIRTVSDSTMAAVDTTTKQSTYIPQKWRNRITEIEKIK